MLLWIGGLALAGFAGMQYWRLEMQPFESTDNAYLRAHMAQVSPKITGYVTEVRFQDNQRVDAGDLLVVIDGASLVARRDQAAAEVAAKRLRRATLEAELAVQDARVAQQRALVSASDASVTRARQDVGRLVGLVEDGAVPAQQRDAAVATRRIAEAERLQRQALVAEATSQRQTIVAQLAEADAALAVAEAGLRTAEVDVAHTRIHAPIGGVLGNRAVQVGQLVQPGVALAFLIPDDEIFVEANFKETQLADMAPGQPADIEIDAYPGTRFAGVIDSAAPASGAEFSLLPPENATGNFTKIVRRVPVKIRFAAGTDTTRLKPGLSSVVKVRVR
ncbi:MAG: HlyD family secretion protein [Gammaproteobacteria bacterium]